MGSSCCKPEGDRCVLEGFEGADSEQRSPFSNVSDRGDDSAIAKPGPLFADEAQELPSDATDGEKAASMAQSEMAITSPTLLTSRTGSNTIQDAWAAVKRGKKKSVSLRSIDVSLGSLSPQSLSPQGSKEHPHRREIYVDAIDSLAHAMYSQEQAAIRRKKREINSAEKAKKAEEEEIQSTDADPQETMYLEAAKQLLEPMQHIPGRFQRRDSSTNLTLNDYTAKHAAEFERVLALETFSKGDGWTFKKEHMGVKVYTKSMKGEPLQYFKGVCEFDSSQGPLHIAEALLQPGERPEWDEQCSYGETPQSYLPFYQYGYVQMRSQRGILSARDMLTHGRLRFEPDGAITIAITSTQLPDYPEAPGFIRADFVEGGYVIRPTDDPEVYTVTYTGCVDQKGWIPTWLANLMAVRQALTLAKLKDHVAVNGPFLGIDAGSLPMSHESSLTSLQWLFR